MPEATPEEVQVILNSINGEDITVTFEAIIENILSRKILKRIIIKSMK